VKVYTSSLTHTRFGFLVACRAGRTGRVRPGNVYRLYTRHAYESYMDEFEPGEMGRIPLDSVILMLKQMLHEEVKPVLMACIEPPDMNTIERSFQSLHKWNFISEPDDHGEITTLGSFVSSLGIDLAFGSFIGLGIQFGVAAEAIEMAAAMSFPKTPFQITSPLIHTPPQYNEIGSNTYIAKCHFDANLYSEPLGLMNLMWDYGIVENKNQFCMHYRIAYARMRQLISTRDSQRKRVADFLGINENRLRMEVPPVHMPQAKITILRLLQVWVFSETMIECAPTTSLKKSSNGSMSLTLSSNRHVLKEEHLAQVLDSDRHPHTIASIQRIDQVGTFVRSQPFHYESFVDDFEPRLISYVIEEGVGLAWCFDEYELNIYIPEEHASRDEFMTSRGSTMEYSTPVFLLAEEHKNTKRRGVFERKCGLWEVQNITGGRAGRGAGAEQRIFRKYTILGNDRETVLFQLSDEAFPISDVKSTVAWNFCSMTRGKKKKKDKIDPSFVVTLHGECSQVSKGDLQDLLGTSNLSSTVLRKDTSQSLVFHNSPNVPYPFKGKDKDNLATAYSLESSSWSRPLIIDDIPQGARLLSTLASGYRKGRNALRFQPSEEDPGEKSDSIEFPLKKEETLISNRWKRLGSGSPVYVPENTVPASATSISRRLYACCSNTLEVRGGGLRVEGLTLLPPNPVFVLLSFLSFGLKPMHASGFHSFSFEANEDSDDREDKKQVKKWMKWLRERWERTTNQECRTSIPDEEEHQPGVEEDAKRRIRMALEFHRSCAEMSEELVCFPDKVDALCSLFNDLDGHTTSKWDSLEERSLTRDNLLLWKHEKKTSTGGEIHQAAFPPRNAKQVGKSREKEGFAPTKTGAKAREGAGNGVNGTKKKADANTVDIIEPAAKEERNSEKWLHGNILRQFSEDTVAQSRRLFITQLESDQQIASDEFASTNILSLLVQVYGGLRAELSMDPSQTRKIKEKSEIGLSSRDWTVICYDDPQGKSWYQAKFVNNVVPKLPVIGRGKNKLPKWLKKKHDRPSRTEDAMACIPEGTNVASLQPWEAKTSKDGQSVLFESIDAALRMEAAFWLERQFCTAGKESTRRWFHHTFEEMLRVLQNYTEQTSSILEE
jgi:hypothetical protein